ncbi:hypothetical protein ACFW04_007705 [Cataglyphis niger]
MLYLMIFLILVIFVCLYYLCDGKPRNYPPGPAWLPFLGCYLTFMRLRSKYEYSHIALQELARTYGPILGLKLGNQKVVVISTYDLVKKTLRCDEFNSRPDGFFFRLRSFGKRKGLVFTEDTTWLQIRRFTTRHLRTFGIGQSVMKKQLMIEARELINHLQEISERGAISMDRVFDVAVLNSLWFMIAGHRFCYEDEKLQQALEVAHDAFRLMDNLGGVVSQIPFLRFIIPELSGYNELMKILKKLWSFIDDEIKMHESDPPPDNQPRDLIDAFLSKMSTKNGDEDTIFDREMLLVLCLDLFLAGSKTTIDTLATAFLFLSLNPEWIKKLQADLDRVVGRSRSPTENDLPSLPMIEAFLTEDTNVLFHYHSAHNDKAHWDEPNVFRPQRFLDERGQFSRNNSTFPFGLGKRHCPGELLARSSLFLFFTNIMHYFDMEISTEHGKPDLKFYDGFTLSPKPYYLKLTKRSDLND